MREGIGVVEMAMDEGGNTDVIGTDRSHDAAWSEDGPRH